MPRRGDRMPPPEQPKEFGYEDGKSFILQWIAEQLKTSKEVRVAISGTTMNVGKSHLAKDLFSVLEGQKIPAFIHTGGMDSGNKDMLEHIKEFLGSENVVHISENEPALYHPPEKRETLRKEAIENLDYSTQTSGLPTLLVTIGNSKMHGKAPGVLLGDIHIDNVDSVVDTFKE